MQRLWASFVVAILCPISAQAGDLVIPYVLQGSAVYIQNDGGADQTVTAEFNAYGNATAVRVTATRKSTVRLESPATGYLRLSSPTPVTAWTVVEGATFPAVTLNGLLLSTTMRRDSGFSLANPWDEDVPVSFTIYVNGGSFVTSFGGIMVRRQAFTSLAGHLIQELLDGLDYVVQIHSSKPLALGVAQAGGRGGFEYVPVTVSGTVSGN